MNYSSPYCHIDDLKPICPYCGYVDEDVQEVHAVHPNWIPGEEIEVECPQCEKKYLITWSISYDTDRIEEDVK